jgi:hypothetical protein
MARINGMKALFGSHQIKNVIENFQKENEKRTLISLQYQGELFVNKARLSGTYRDITGNLRSSIGYVILKNGVEVDSNFIGNSDGSLKGKNVANEVAKQYPKGYVLIGVAGMDYAAYVEAKNYDVITGSAPTSAELKSILNAINS